MALRIHDCGDSALVAELGSIVSPEVSAAVQSLARALRAAAAQTPGVVDVVPAYCSLMVSYDPLVLSAADLRSLIHLAYSQGSCEEAPGRLLRVPVAYGGAFGPDLPAVARLAHLGETEVVRLHCSVDYPVQMLGFMPGFPYLAGLDPRIHAPRLEEPRLRIPAGSVGIGGQQTGIYPLNAPGGWQLIGRTPLRVFDPQRSNPVPYEPGDVLRFVPVDEDRFQRLAQAEQEGAGVLWNVGPEADPAVADLWQTEGERP